MVVVEFFPVDLKYKIVDNRTHTYIFGKTFDGKRVCVIDRETSPYFYVIPKDVIFANKIVERIKTYNDPEGNFEFLSSKLVDTKYLGKSITAIKIFVNRPFALKFFDLEIKKDSLLKEYVGAVLETDVLYTRRYLLDKKIVPFELVAVTGEIVTQNFRVATLIVEKFEVGGDSLNSLNGLSFNISQEADGSIISISYCDKFSSKVITWKKNPSILSNIEFVDGEAELISKFKQVLDEHKPDVLIGYDSSQKMINITRRAEKYHLRFDINLDRTTPSENNGTTSGIVHLDLKRLLNTFSKKLFGSSISPQTGKLMDLVNNSTESSEFSTLDKELYDQFFTNSVDGAKYIFKLFQEITPYAMELSKQVGHTLKSIQFMGQESLIESYLIRNAIANDELIPKKPSDIIAINRKREIFINNYVYENNSLMEDDFLEFDFSSIYPAVIISKNISFETSDCECCDTPFCLNKKGFLPLVLEDVVSRRLRIKEIIKASDSQVSNTLDARQKILKILTNSIMRYLIYPNARWFDLTCIKELQAGTRERAKEIVMLLEKEGLKVLYADSKTAFVKKTNQVFSIIEKLNHSFNDYSLIENKRLFQKGIFLEVEKFNGKNLRRYALLANDGSLVLKGFYHLRKTFCKFAKTTQEKFLRLLLEGLNAEEYYDSRVKDLEEEKIPLSKLISCYKLKKDAEYYKIQTPGLTVVKQLIQSGIDVKKNFVVEYIVTKGTSYYDNAISPVYAKSYNPRFYKDVQLRLLIHPFEDFFDKRMFEDVLEEKEEDVDEELVEKTESITQESTVNKINSETLETKEDVTQDARTLDARTVNEEKELGQQSLDEW